MKAKQKALELYLKFSRYTDSEFTEFHHKDTKECALITVDEIIDFMLIQLKWDEKYNGNIIYWQEVKQEIEKL